MIPFQPISRPQAAVRAGLLTLLILLGAALTVCADAGTARAEIRDDPASHVYVAGGGALRPPAGPMPRFAARLHPPGE